MKSGQPGEGGHLNSRFGWIVEQLLGSVNTHSGHSIEFHAADWLQARKPESSRALLNKGQNEHSDFGGRPYEVEIAPFESNIRAY
jgi:hypothetical protein